MLGAVLAVLAGVLIGTNTGLLMRRAQANISPTSASVHFPRLSVLSALVTGTALAEVIVILAIRQWASLAALITGPLLAFYGFFWFSDSLTSYRQSIAAKTLPNTAQAAESLPTRLPTSSLMQVGLGIQMGFLLCAAGARDLVSLALALCVAFIAGTAVLPERAQDAAVQRWPEMTRCATGALLCALGSGTLVERMSERTVSGEAVTAIIAIALWAAASIAVRRALG
jgi:hypothetical protein